MELTQKVNLTDLPEDVLIHIQKLLTHRDIMSIYSVQKQNDNKFVSLRLKYLCEQFSILLSDTKFSSLKNIYLLGISLGNFKHIVLDFDNTSNKKQQRLFREFMSTLLKLFTYNKKLKLNLALAKFFYKYHDSIAKIFQLKPFDEEVIVHEFVGCFPGVNKDANEFSNPELNVNGEKAAIYLCLAFNYFTIAKTLAEKNFLQMLEKKGFQNRFVEYVSISENFKKSVDYFLRVIRYINFLNQLSIELSSNLPQLYLHVASALFHITLFEVIRIRHNSGDFYSGSPDLSSNTDFFNYFLKAFVEDAKSLKIDSHILLICCDVLYNINKLNVLVDYFELKQLLAISKKPNSNTQKLNLKFFRKLDAKSNSDKAVLVKLATFTQKKLNESRLNQTKFNQSHKFSGTELLEEFNSSLNTTSSSIVLKS